MKRKDYFFLPFFTGEVAGFEGVEKGVSDSSYGCSVATDGPVRTSFEGDEEPRLSKTKETKIHV